MQWIDGISWTGSGYYTQVRNRQNEVSLHPIAKLADVLRSTAERTSNFRLESDFLDWKPLTPSQGSAFQVEMGYPDGRPGQDFYEFSCSGQPYIVPAGVLMCSMFRPFKGIARYLLSPQGLENLFVPSGNEEHPELQFFVSARGSTGLQTDKATGILNALSWMYCFPSAWRMWSSVLPYARAGRLALSLPEGSFKCYGRSVALKDKSLVTDLRLAILRTTETPLEHYSKHTRIIEFERVLHKEVRNPTTIMVRTLHSRDGRYGLSDAEWLAVRAELEKPLYSSHRQHAPRVMVDKILDKLGRGITWKAAGDDKKMSELLAKTYARLKADGRLAYLLDYLSTSREAP